MDDGREEHDENSTERGNGAVAVSTLKSAASYIAASSATGRESDGSGTAFAASFSSLLEWGEASGLILPQSDFAFFDRRTDGKGDEHEAWFEQTTNRWFKATYPNRFGLAWGRQGSATVCEYLTRLTLQNEYFGDDIELVALVNTEGKLRILTSQPHIVGEAAPYGMIQHWLFGLGFERLCANDCIAWYRRADNLLIADAHEGNVILSPSGTLFAIDINAILPTGALLDGLIEILGRAK